METTDKDNANEKATEELELAKNKLSEHAKSVADIIKPYIDDIASMKRLTTDFNVELLNALSVSDFLECAAFSTGVLYGLSAKTEELTRLFAMRHLIKHAMQGFSFATNSVDEGDTCSKQ